MANETLTENIVYDHFKNDPLFSDKTIKVILERQQSANILIDELLKGATKTGKSGKGRPDFIITFPTNSDYIIVIETKAEISKHESKNSTKQENIRDYAVDGVLHYSKILSREFNVLAIAVSGETKDNLSVSHFLWKKGNSDYEKLENDRELRSINSYLKYFRNEHFADTLLHINIVDKAIYLNELFHAYSIQENERCTLVSAILLALTYEPFRNSFTSYPTTDALTKAILESDNQVINLSGVRNIPQMLAEYSKLNATVLFSSDTIRNTKTRQTKTTLGVLKTEVISYLYQNIYPLLSKEEKGFDVLGKFYSEFIRYAGTQQSLGLVLTPQHITDLFCDLSNISKDDVLYDCCCGTGGFLIAGMKRMFALAGSDEDKKYKIKSQQLCGVEMLPQMYTYTCSNMMLRGDGKTNIYNGDCFNCTPFIIPHKPTVAFLNPPYNVGSDGQMKFIEHALEMVAPQNGRVVAIVQMSCAIKNEKELIAVKNRILTKHHLKAVLSMPDDLFYPVGVVTCIMVFEANKPNEGRKTWFGYFKDDGFEKRKNLGRIDARNQYNDIKERWLSAYRNLDEIAGLSVRQEVKGEDEWCAEAYMETDYSTLTDEDFIKKMRDYAAFMLKNSNPYLEVNFSNIPLSNNKISLNERKWEWFLLNDLFKVSRGTRLTKPDREKGNIPLITAGKENEGVAGYISNEEMIRYNNAITIDMFGFSCFRNYKFCCDDNVLVLENKKIPQFAKVFISTLINNDSYKCAYGRQYRQKTLAKHQIKLPITPQGEPDWQFMEDYIKSLPYSGCL